MDDVDHLAIRVRITSHTHKEFLMLFKDPVCGKRIQRGKAHIVIEYEGVNYFLCCPRCQMEFEHNMKLYARPELGEKAKKLTQVPHRPYN
jgi:YHS domain-containing protein